MCRAPKAGDTGRNASERVGTRRPGETHGRGRGILFVIGLQDQQFFHRVFDIGIDDIGFGRHAEGHPQEVAGERQRVVGIDEGLADRIFIRHRSQCRHLRDEPVAGDHALVRVVNVGRIMIKGRHRANDAAHDRHRMRVTAEAAIELRQLLMDHRVAGDVVGEFGIFGRVGQIAVEQKVRHFEKVGFFGQLVDRIAAIEQHAGVTVDIGDLGFARGGAGEAGIKGKAARVGVKLADIYDFGAHGALQHRIILGIAINGELRRSGHAVAS